MGLAANLAAAFNADVSNDTTRVLSSGVQVPVSGAPGAWKIMVADAAVAVDYWLLGMAADTPSGAGIFDYTVATPQAGTTALVTSFHFEVATDAGGYMSLLLPLPVRIVQSATNGLACRQETASVKTCNVFALYATGLGT